jgi:hypothetical protein
MDFVFTRRKAPAQLEPAKVDPKALPEEVARLAGDWTGTFSMTAKTDAGSVPAGACTATESSRLICGGKWLWTDMQAELGGRSHAGGGVLGYDSKTGKYTSVGWDNQNGTFAVAHGTSDGKTRSMEGTVVDPTGTSKAWWESSSWTDSDHRVLTWKVAGTASAPEMHVDAKYERAK